MCRGGGMFNPTKKWRRWHRKVNRTQKRHAVVSALAASSLPPLVMARGHRIGAVSELPLVVSAGAESLQKTKQAIELLKKLGCEEELTRILDSKKVRRGIGKVRVSRYSMRRGPLVVYSEDNGIKKAMRNIPGVETAHVDRLNLLTLAPGGHFGRFIIWTEGAFKRLSQIYGHGRGAAPLKNGYHLPRAQMANADVARIINSEEVQSVLRPKLEPPKRHGKKRNALANAAIMEKLNPGARQRRVLRKRASTKGTKEYDQVQKQKKKRMEASAAYNKKAKKGDDTYYKKLMKAFETKEEPKDEAEGEEEE